MSLKGSFAKRLPDEDILEEAEASLKLKSGNPDNAHVHPFSSLNKAEDTEESNSRSSMISIKSDKLAQFMPKISYEDMDSSQDNDNSRKS